MKTNVPFIFKTAAAGTAALLLAGIPPIFAAPVESVDAAANFSAVESPASDALAGADINRMALGGQIAAGLSAAAMSEDFAQSEALLPLSASGLSPAPLEGAANSSSNAFVPMKKTAPSSVVTAKQALIHADKKGARPALERVARLAQEMRKSGAGNRARELNAFYGDDDGSAALQTEIQKDKDGINVGVNADSVARILSEAKHPKIALELARQGLRAANHITAEYTAMALGQIARIKAMRRHPKEIAALYRTALRKRDVDVRRYAAWHMDLFAKAFLATHPKLVAEIFKMALRDKDAYVRGYALQNLEEFPGLSRALTASIRRAQARPAN
ncbi:MAG TPA: hypothetical protein VNK24_02790 [Elusimicrobiota bacterium]|nr:hypothetical protein [Elusimicrobiota bacterium]